MKDVKKAWRKRSREYLAAAFGGCCAICGYDKAIAALDYHHVDPKEKDHALSKGRVNGRAWAVIVQEARKCVCLCCRCHREVHAGVTQLPSNCRRFNEEYADIWQLRKREFNHCPECGEEKYVKLKYCSPSCAHKSQRKFEISKEELQQLVDSKPYEEIGTMFGVSGNAIKKRCKALGIELPNRLGYWSKKRAGVD